MTATTNVQTTNAVASGDTVGAQVITAEPGARASAMVAAAVDPAKQLESTTDEWATICHRQAKW